MVEEFKSFGRTLREKRMGLGLTLEQVARRIRSHKGYVSGIENGKVNPPSPKFVKRFAKALDLDETMLLLTAHAEKAPIEIRTAVRSTVGHAYKQAKEILAAISKVV